MRDSDRIRNNYGFSFNEWGFSGLLVPRNPGSLVKRHNFYLLLNTRTHFLSEPFTAQPETVRIEHQKLVFNWY